MNDVINQAGTFLSKPGVVRHLERNSTEIAVFMGRYVRDPYFSRAIAEKLIEMVEKVHPETAHSMSKHLSTK